MKYWILIFLLVFTAAGCNQKVAFNQNSDTPVDSDEYVPNVGEYCEYNQECKTPFDYLVRSNCPFASACIDNTCKVICPMIYHDKNPDISRSYPEECTNDSECDCSERGENSLSCKCLEGGCVSVEAE